MAAPTAPDHSLAKYREQFPIFESAIYLNSCSLGALSRRSRARVLEQLDLWDSRGASAWYDTWLPALDELRAGYARLIGAAQREVALHPSISSALTAVGAALDYRRRPRVVTTSLDFPTIPYQWMAQAPAGVEVELIESTDQTTVPLEAFERAVDDRTALVATSHVFFASGAIQDVGALAEITRRRGALLLIDGYQAAGQLPVDVHALGVDFYCAGGLKWLLGGPGIAFLYCREGLIEALRPRATGWFAHADPFRFDPRGFEPRGDARRFEFGTPSMAAVYAQLGGLEVLTQIGAPAIRRVTQALTEELIEQAQARGLRPKVAPTAAGRSGIIMLPHADPAGAVRRLAAERIVADARPGHVRLSPYFYNLSSDGQAALECLTRA